MTNSPDEKTFIPRRIDLERTGKRIRVLRKSRGISVIRMGDLIGVTAAAIYKWERGKGLPDIGNVPNICNVLGEPFEGIFICKPEKSTEI